MEFPIPTQAVENKTSFKIENDYVTTDLSKEGILTVWLDRKGESQNIITLDLIDLIESLIVEVDTNPDIRAVIFISKKKDFVAGADINSFKADKPGDFMPIIRKGHDLLNRIQNSTKPYVSAIHGTCYGLGVELSLACHARIATKARSTKLALPEVKLGLLPGQGGTQRLPRLVGVQKALEMMLTGKNVYAYPALKMGLVDDIVEPVKLHKAACILAKKLITRPIVRKDKQNFLGKLLDSKYGRSIVFNQARAKAMKQSQGNYPAIPKIIDCVEIGMNKGMMAGLEAEAQHFEELLLTDESKALISLFHNMTNKKKNPMPDLVKPVNTIAMLGAGFMGAGIAEVSITNDIEVVLKDIQEDMLTSAKKTIWKGLNKKIKRKTLSKVEAYQTLNRLDAQLDYEDFKKADVVIEAVVEKMEVKKAVLKELEAVCKPDFIFATNTSALPITEIASVAKKPENVIGMHYFSPVPKMPLLEIVKTEKTADWVIATCFDIGVRQGKTCIVVKDTPGFYVNRILAPYMNEVMLMIEEGAAIEVLDKQMVKLGFPVGPVTLIDEVGIDVCAHVMTGDLMDAVSKREGIAISHGLPTLYEAGYKGRKNGKGFYKYDKKTGKRAKVNESVYALFGSDKRQEMNPAEMQNRAFMLMLNEALMCLEEGIIANPTDGDVGAVFGIGFLPFTGGPFRYIDMVGANTVVRVMETLASKYGPKFRPAQILVEHANAGLKFHPEG